MNWVEYISLAIEYIENHLLEDITIYDIAQHVGLSPFYFQKGFSMICGLSMSEYTRKRRLSLAGDDLIMGNGKVIDIALNMDMIHQIVLQKRLLVFMELLHVL